VAGCSDKHFEEMLHAYELGMLSDADREAFELHMMDCRSCFEKAQKMAEAAAMVRRDPDIRSAIEKIAEPDAEEDRAEATDEPRSFFRRKLRLSLVPSLIVAGLLIALILKPWQIEIHSTQEAVAVQNKLAIMYFENLADPEDEGRLGDIITSLLITDLSESQYVNVISSQRLYDIARAMGKDGRSGLDKETAMEIAERAEAEWMVLGSIHQIEPYYSIAGQLVEVSTGDVLASQLIAGEPGEDIFTLVDRLTIEIKNDMALPSDAGHEPDRMVSEVTTNSPEAYRYYLEGIEYYHKMYLDEAGKNFKKAIELDSTFAMAYYYYASTVSSENRSSMEKALKYLDRVTQKERLYILSKEAAANRDIRMAINYLEQIIDRYPDDKEALFLTGSYHYSLREYKKAIEFFEKVIQLDPFHKTSLNMMAYCYYAVEDYDAAIESLDRYVTIAPDEANPYDTRGDILSRIGRYDEAMDAYRKAVEIKPDFISSAIALINLSLHQRNYAEAEHYRQDLAVSGIDFADSWCNLYLGILYAYQGRLRETIKTIDKYIDRDIEDKNYAMAADKYYLISTCYAGLKQYDKAVENIELADEVYVHTEGKKSMVYTHIQIQYLAESGYFDEARKLLSEYGRNASSNTMMLGRYHYCNGIIAFELGDFDQAIDEFKQSLNVRTGYSYLTNYMLARSYMENGEYETSIPLFERLLRETGIWRLYYGVEDTRTFFYLGFVNERLGNIDKAIRRYEAFVKFWENADPEFDAELDDARQRLARLKSRI